MFIGDLDEIIDDKAICYVIGSALVTDQIVIDLIRAKSKME